ncbi:MAG: hypothetical protein WD601_08110, partial [Pseudohongiellaceae bacterium]
GVLGAPDVIDEAYPELDFNYTHFWSDQLVVSVKARNLLNQLRETTQGGLDFNSYREGRNYSVSLTYNF